MTRTRRQLSRPAPAGHLKRRRLSQRTRHLIARQVTPWQCPRCCGDGCVVGSGISTVGAVGRSYPRNRGWGQRPRGYRIGQLHRPSGATDCCP